MLIPSWAGATVNLHLVSRAARVSRKKKKSCPVGCKPEGRLVWRTGYQKSCPVGYNLKVVWCGALVSRLVWSTGYQRSCPVGYNLKVVWCGALESRLVWNTGYQKSCPVGYKPEGRLVWRT